VSPALVETSDLRLLDGIRRDGRPVSLAGHLKLHGALDADPRELIDLVDAAGLSGRGGASFPTAVKLRAVAAGRRAVVVANGAEGEPPSGKDKVLLAYTPHLVLDGAVLAARAVNAREVIVAVSQAVLAHVEHAIDERREAKLDPRVELRAVAVPETFVAGEETALVRYLNGGPALPTFTPPRPYERGVRGLPTLVQNVETLAHLALIARHGAAWFRAAGTRDEPGTALVTLSGAVRRPGVYEIALGTPLGGLLADAGGLTSDVRAFLVGGYFGTWIRRSADDDLPLSDAGLASAGASLGARAIVALPASACGVRETARIGRYLADESAGQCGPCVHGLAAVAGDLEQLTRRDGRVDRARLERRLAVIAGRGACSHPDGAVKLVASGLRAFADDVDRHLAGRRCVAVAR
jgi:NADH:ubiquinone oxidoreductase subunit F (NADH-binding)